MAISRSQLVKELEPGLNALFGLEYNRYENQHAEIFATETSDRAFEEETIALAFAITEEAIEDNLYDRLAARYTRALARSMSNTKQVKAANILNNAENAAFPGGDGKPLIANNHPLATGGTFSNVLATAADLNETSLEQSLIDISSFVDERGLKIASQGVKMIIPKELQFTAERLMKSPQRTSTADNDINAIVSMGMVPQGYRVNNFLSDNDAFFLMTDVPNGFKMFVRAPIKTAMEGDFDTGNVRFKARERYSFGFSDPRCVFGNGKL